MGRFQHYSDTFYEEGGEQTTQEFELTLNKNIPVGFFVAETDEYFPVEYTEAASKTLGDMSQFYKSYIGTN